MAAFEISINRQISIFLFLSCGGEADQSQVHNYLFSECPEDFFNTCAAFNDEFNINRNSVVKYAKINAERSGI